MSDERSREKECPVQSSLNGRKWKNLAGKRRRRIEERRLQKWIRRMRLEQKKQVQNYLKRIRWRMRRKQRYFLCALAAAVAVYLSGMWKLRERIWSIAGTEEIEYQVPDWNMWNAVSESGEKEEKEGTSTKIRLHIKTGDLEIVHERTELEKSSE